MYMIRTEPRSTRTLKRWRVGSMSLRTRERSSTFSIWARWPQLSKRWSNSVWGQLAVKRAAWKAIALSHQLQKDQWHLSTPRADLQGKNSLQITRATTITSLRARSFSAHPRSWPQALSRSPRPNPPAFAPPSTQARPSRWSPRSPSTWSATSTKTRPPSKKSSLSTRNNLINHNRTFICKHPSSKIPPDRPIPSPHHPSLIDQVEVTDRTVPKPMLTIIIGKLVEIRSHKTRRGLTMGVKTRGDLPTRRLSTLRPIRVNRISQVLL